MWYIPSWAAGVAVIIFAVSLGQALTRLLGGRRPPSGRGAPPDMTEFRDALAQVQQRLGELEERLDFAERLLAQQRDGERLGPPGG